VTVKIIRTKIYDPWMNLAVEEYLLEDIKEGEYILYLWQNENTVVIGKNQNPWSECRSELLEKENGKLARRISGGGAVYHDLGNLNFTFIMRKDKYDLDKQFDVILNSVKALGINAIKTGRNDIVVDNKKFSGNAFCFKKHSAYHHGTILVSANLNKLTKFLQVSKDKIEAKGIKSVRSRVTNLNEINKDITIDMVGDAIIKAYTKIYGKAEKIYDSINHLDSKKLDELYKKYSSWEFRYGEAPKFDITFETRFIWGGVTFGFSLKKGIVEKMKIYSDAMDEQYISQLEIQLHSIRFTKNDIIKAVSELYANKEQLVMKNDIIKYFESKEF